MEDRDRIEAIGNVIHDYWGEIEKREKKRYTLNELARHFQVNPTSLSYWTRRLREPDEENKQRLAARIGYIRFYQAIGEQPRFPKVAGNGKKAEKIAKAVETASDEHISEDDIDEMIVFLEKRRAERRKSKAEASA